MYYKATYSSSFEDVGTAYIIQYTRLNSTKAIGNIFRDILSIFCALILLSGSATFGAFLLSRPLSTLLTCNRITGICQNHCNNRLNCLHFGMLRAILSNVRSNCAVKLLHSDCVISEDLIFTQDDVIVLLFFK